MFRIPLSEAGKFRVKYRVELREFAKNSDFSTGDLEKFLYIFHKLGKTKEKFITMHKFLEMVNHLIHYENDFLHHRITWTLCCGYKLQVSPEIWMRTMEIFFTNNRKKRIQYCFNVYKDREFEYIKREQMHKFLQNCFNFKHPQENEEAIQDLIIMIFHQFKTEDRHKIIFEEYERIVMKTPLLMEFLGPCLPEMTKEQFFDHLLNKKII